MRHIDSKIGCSEEKKTGDRKTGKDKVDGGIIVSDPVCKWDSESESPPPFLTFVTVWMMNVAKAG